MEDIQKKAEQLAQEMAAAKAQAAAAEAKAAGLENELKTANTSIANLDSSIKDQQKTIDQLRVEVKASKSTDFKSAFREAFYAQKEAIMEMVGKKADKFGVTLELKAVTAVGTNHITPNNFAGVAVDPVVQGTVPAANVFVATFGYRPRTGNKLGWIEASSQTGADYVAELANNTAQSDVNFVEKSRAFGKIATFMTISTEIEDWFDNLFNYCLNEGVRLIEAKVDAEIYGGNGSDSSNPTHIYGLKGQSTAFSALAAGSVEKANVADVIIDAAEQVAKNGFSANVAFLSWGLYAQLKEVKSTTGEYLFDRVNNLLNGIRVLPSSRMAATEILVGDSTCVEVYAGNSYELELVRDGAIDGYKVYFRKAVQVKVPTAKKLGLVYVANASTAIAALLKSE